MMATGNISKASFDYIIDIVLARGDGSSLKKSLIQHGYTDIHDLMMLNDDVISSFLTMNTKEDSTSRS
jgi:hypothetical protein